MMSTNNFKIDLVLNKLPTAVRDAAIQKAKDLKEIISVINMPSKISAQNQKYS
jgi:archaellum component FlaG (FlaF/FlaG flagellin family)